MLPWRWEAEGLVRIQLCILTQAELSEHHQQQFLFLGTRPGHLPLAFAPLQGEVHRKAEQQFGSNTGAQVLGQSWIWNGPNQSKGVGIASGISVRGNNLHHLTLQQL